MTEQQFPTNLLQTLIDESVPVLRHFYFTFLIEEMPIAFREQLVRSQYDHYWIQSGRITDWRNALIESPDLGDHHLNESQRILIRQLQLFFHDAHESGIAPEDYRHLVPVGAYHRGIWTANLESLITRFKKRSCWVAQSGYWHDVLTQIKPQLEAAIGCKIPIRPPCRDKDWNHTGCTVAGVMTDRATGSDPLPCCPLFLDKEGDYVDWGEDWDSIPSPERLHLRKLLSDHPKRVEEFFTLWSKPCDLL